MTKMDESEVIGLRIESEGFLGTVLYQGEVPPTKGLWLGIDWDDHSRGKHDGSNKGVHYFTASHPTSGSFMRPLKVNFGVKFCDAMQDRYGRIDDDNAGINKEEMYVVGKNQQQTYVEVVGAHSVNMLQSKFHELTEVSLRDMRLSDPGCDGEIGALIPNVEELEIRFSLFSSWLSVEKITKQLPKLEILNVSDNRLVVPVKNEALIESFSQVRVLYMNRMNYDWNQILSCFSLFSHAEVLHICFNRIQTINRLIPNLNNITLFNIESNQIDGWESVLCLGKLPKLESLILNDTGIANIYFNDADHGAETATFPSLKNLSISHNKIDKWITVNELNKLPKITHLYFKFNPLTESAGLETIRSITIAKMSKLQYLNRTQITSGDRKGAEIDYLKNHGKVWRSSGGHQDPAQNKPSAEFSAEHPNYQTLLNKYGPPEDSELKEHSSALKNSLITVFVDCPQKSEQKTLKKKLPITMNVQKLKTLLQRLCKVDAYDMKLSYSSHKHEDGPEIELDNDMKEIDFYSIEEGDHIHVKY